MMIIQEMRALLSANQVVLFMVGEPGNTYCDRSESVLKILDNYTVQYITIDALENDDSFDAVQEITGHPTVPQLFVNNQLFGGYEKIVEMTYTCEFPDALDTLGVKIHNKGNIRPMP